MIFLLMHVSDMTEQRRQTLPRGVIFTKQPSDPTTMVLLISYRLRLQIGIHTWVLIHQVMNFMQSIPINLVNLCLLDISSNPDCSGLTPNSRPNTFPKKTARQKWTGPIYLPGHIYKLLSQEAKDALQKYNVEAIQKLKASRSLHETNFVHDLHEDTQDNSPSSKEDDEFQEHQQYNTDQDLEPPTDDLLDFISSQEHSDDQLDQVLQTYQAYQESQTESQTPTRQLNTHITYHVAQAN